MDRYIKKMSALEVVPSKATELAKFSAGKTPSSDPVEARDHLAPTIVFLNDHYIADDMNIIYCRTSLGTFSDLHLGIGVAYLFKK